MGVPYCLSRGKYHKAPAVTANPNWKLPARPGNIGRFGRFTQDRAGQGKAKAGGVLPDDVVYDRTGRRRQNCGVHSEPLFKESTQWPLLDRMRGRARKLGGSFAVNHHCKAFA